ncbi:hypothetical protein EDB84DRAFT_345803 [Lactarius hengduanensis]|nr:hypothetical protein EDB84DRAFT_345803 [Lactarius hengduanensis]
MSYLPAAILFKPFRSVTINRQQFALTPAYAFTDIKLQGQTLQCVKIDIGKPPSDALTGFNA